MSQGRLASALMTSPILWGCAAGGAFYYLGTSGFITNELVLRYLGGYWINYVETTMFFVGLAALIFKALDVFSQLRTVQQPLLPAIPVGGQPVEHAGQLAARLSTAALSGYLPRRLSDALEFVRRKGTASGLDDELKYLSDMDAVRSQQSYSFLRVIIWAIPIMGFLGTVIGITIAISSLDPQALEGSLSQVVAGLGMSFDTTAIALAFSMVLMFGQHSIDRYETRLLSEVDARTTAEISGRFQDIDKKTDPQTHKVARMAEVLLQNTEDLVVRQAELWQSSIESTNRRWAEMTQKSAQQLEHVLAKALSSSLQHYAHQFAEIEQQATSQNREQWKQLQIAIQQNSEINLVQQQELRKQGEVMLKIAEATNEVSDLELALNRNLQSLAGAKNFEDTVMSLSAAIHLLSAKLGALPHEGKTVELGKSKRQAAA